MERILVFPDTNILLHFRPINEIDLPGILGYDEVTLMFAPIVISELDHLKWEHPNKGIRNRANASVRKVKEWLSQQTPVRPDVTAKLVPLPSEDTYKTYHLNKRSNDDLLLASILEQRNLQAPKEIICLTADVGIQLRAEALGLRTFELDSDYQLPHAQDALTKENIQLKQELAELKGSVPTIEFFFDDRTKQLV